MIEIHVTCKDEKEAEKIAKALLEGKLVACANYFPVKSMFSWKGKIEKAKEFMLILKTNDRQKEKTVRKIKDLCSYDLPVITWNEVNTTKDAKDWINNSV